MRRNRRSDERPKAESSYNSKHWRRSDPQWPAQKLASADLPSYDPCYQSTPRPLLYPMHEQYPPTGPHFCNTLCPDKLAHNEKKNHFNAFLQSFSTFLVEAKNKSEDMAILREVLEPLLHDDLERNFENSMQKRLELLEEQINRETVVNDSQLIQRIQSLEDQISNGSSIHQRLENLEIVIYGNLVQRMDSVEQKCYNLGITTTQPSDEDRSSCNEPFNPNIAQVEERLASVESQVTEGGTLQTRLHDLEKRLSDVENATINNRKRQESYCENKHEGESSNSSRNFSSVTETTTATTRDTIIDVSPKRKRPKEIRNNEEDVKNIPVDQGVMRFIIDKDEFVSIFIDGEGTKSAENISGIRVWFGDQHPLNVSRPITNEMTSNVAQLMAAQIAIDLAVHAGLKKIIIHSSSKFLINSMTKLNSWHERKWVKKNGQPLKHVEKLKRLRRSLLPISALFKEASSFNEARLLAEVCEKIKKEKE